MLIHKFRSVALLGAALAANASGATMAYVSDVDAGEDVNFVPLRNVYPGADGGTLATLGSASSPDGVGVTGDVPDMDVRTVDTPVSTTGGLQWWLGIAVLIGVMMFVAKKVGAADEFKNIRASTYNVAFITFVAILGFTLLKIVAVRVKRVPLLGGFSQVVLAA